MSLYGFVTLYRTLAVVVLPIMETTLAVIEVTVPVFALVALGIVLRARGFIDAAGQAFASRLVYTIALPSLILLAVAQQDLGALFAPPVIVATLGVTVGLFVLFLVLGGWCGLRGPRRSFLAWSPFWANVSYLGFPLAERAWGDAGLAQAAIVNAFTMPAFVILGIGSLQFYGGRGDGLGRTVRMALWNPVVISASLGIVISLGRYGAANMGLPVLPEERAPALNIGINLIASVLDLVGRMGLPLALIAVGAALRLDALRGDLRLLVVASIGKLLVAPGLTLLVFYLLFPDADPVARGIAVLLMATPAAATSAVICQRLGLASEESAAHLVISTALSVCTIPLWLALLH